MPRLTRYPSTGDGDDDASSWSFRHSLQNNGEPVIAVLLGVCLYLLYRWMT